MALTEEQSKEIEGVLKEQLHDSYLRGMQIGLLTASTVVLEKLNDVSKPLTNRVGDVKAFCKVATSQKKKILNRANSDISELVNGANTDDMYKDVYGKWVVGEDTRLHCSICGFGRETDAQSDWMFCPICGTKMEFLVYGG